MNALCANRGRQRGDGLDTMRADRARRVQSTCHNTATSPQSTRGPKKHADLANDDFVCAQIPQYIARLFVEQVEIEIAV